jgi:hypothetical protein
VVLHPDGTATYGHHEPGTSILPALDPHIPDLGTQGLARRFRMFFSDTFTPDMLANPLADRVIGTLGYTHRTGWFGTVAVSMEEDWAGEIGPLTPEVRATIDELIEQVNG